MRGIQISELLIFQQFGTKVRNKDSLIVFAGLNRWVLNTCDIKNKYIGVHSNLSLCKKKKELMLYQTIKK